MGALVVGGHGFGFRGLQPVGLYPVTVTIVERPRGGSKGVVAVLRMCRSFWVAVCLFRPETLGITPRVLGACAFNVVQLSLGASCQKAYTPGR